MDSSRVTNGLLFAIALALLTHLALALSNRPVEAETFHLDGCITQRPGDKPAGYVHVVVHSQADVDSLKGS
ncbi:MAG: hypothetical protein HY211_04490 [Candidatus Omnitrophica bacterium]|nr:hypothetical protein [Candidatus Omnitrophota bacterium]